MDPALGNGNSQARTKESSSLEQAVLSVTDATQTDRNRNPLPRARPNKRMIEAASRRACQPRLPPQLLNRSIHGKRSQIILECEPSAIRISV
jgi:hypothetical protein